MAAQIVIDARPINREVTSHAQKLPVADGARQILPYSR
jgi:hypothetical protein